VLFVCPHDRGPFEPTASGVRCPLGHSFDRAREGYLNLVIGGRKKGRAAGDSAAMLQARRAVFAAGHYQPVLDAVAGTVAESAPGGVVLDAGCGEGSYLARLGEVAPSTERWGIDIAKAAVRLAARRDRSGGFAVASAYALPVAGGTVDAVMSVFSPRPFAEFGRVLRARGVVVAASPGRDHLAGLTDLVYGRHREHDERPHAAEDPQLPLAPAHRSRVRYSLALDEPASIANLLQMTPYYWHAPPDRRAAIADLETLETIVDVIVTVHVMGAPSVSG
jgi:23S rRNA (guanine745-N1)-methyltransferase